MSIITWSENQWPQNWQPFPFLFKIFPTLSASVLFLSSDTSFAYGSECKTADLSLRISLIGLSVYVGINYTNMIRPMCQGCKKKKRKKKWGNGNNSY